MQPRADIPRRIAICVDDFGLHPGVAAAAVALAHQGRISAVSVQAGAPAWSGSAPALRELAGCGVAAGLHLDLTQHPLDAGLRAPVGAWVVRAFTGRVPRPRLRREIEAQLDRFESVAGRPPAHVDGHQHVHQLAVVRELLVAALVARYPGQLPWLRSTRRPRPRALGKAALLEHLGCRGLERLAREKGFRQNGHLLGVYDFGADAGRYLALLGDWLHQALAGDLLMCHPAMGGGGGDPIGAARRTEFGVLSGAAFGALLAAQRVRVGSI